jgi:NAD(P)-dependent dehydrogenase (short-subunit alcohol dehydrogenase family)
MKQRHQEALLTRRDPGAFYKQLFNLEDKVAVIIGGTGALCGKMAWGLLQAGVRVVLVGRDEEKANNLFKLWESASEDARFFKADVTQRCEIEHIIPNVLSWYGQIDIWINGATIAPPVPYFEINDEQFDSILDVNLKAVHVACQIIGKHWVDHKKQGSIINMSSMGAIRPLSRSFVYSLAKAGLLNLTQNLAREWAKYGIRVNALCPGFFPSEQNREILDKQRVEAIMRQTPMDRFGEPTELVGATLLLSSQKAGSFITGSNLVVDGGFSTMSI